MGDQDTDATWRAAFDRVVAPLPAATLATVLEASADALVLARAVPVGTGAAPGTEPEGGADDLLVCWMNPTARRIHGERDDLLGRTVRDVWPEAETSGALATCLGVLSTGEVGVGAFEWALPGRTPCAYAFRVVPLGEGIVLWALRSVEDQVDQARALGGRTADLQRSLLAERAARRLLEEQASMVYEQVVQALVGAKMGLELGDDQGEVIDEIDRALGAAKQISTSGNLAGRLAGVGLEPEPPEDPDRPDRTRTMICDDDALIRDLMARALGMSDDFVVVGQAANGREAVDRLEEMAPDLVLLDLNMPVLSGMQALPMIRAARPDAVVVVISGLLESAARGQSLAAGATAYIEKGSSVFGLVDQLRDIVRRAAAGG